MRGTINAPGASGPKAKAIQKIAEDAAALAQTAKDAADAAAGSGGGNAISITFGPEFAGHAYQVTDGSGDSYSGVVPDGLKVTVNVKNCNTIYTVTGTVADGSSYSNTVTTGPYYGQYTVAVSVFTATINVNAVAGATVTATGTKGNTYSAVAGSNGVAAIAVKQADTYSIQATFDGCASSTTSVNVTSSGASHTAAVTFITLTIKVDSGSAVTVSQGSTNKSFTSTGSDKVYLPSTGTWNVVATKNGESASGAVNCSGFSSFNIELAYVKIYGVTWDKTSKTVLSRTDDAAGFTDPNPSLGGGAGSSPFDNCLPWSGMVKESRTGGVMVKIPKFWFKWTNSSGSLKLQIADKAVEGFHVSPAHADRGDGKGERDYVYIARYKCNDSYKSATGASPKVNITRATARTGIHNLGANIWQQDFALFWTTRMLYLVEYANWNGQATLGYNCGNGSSRQNTGSTDSMQYHTGTMHSSRTTYGVGVQYRWIEDPWGSVLEWCDGIYFSGANVYCIKNPASFSDTSGGTKTGTRPTNGGYISAWAIPTAAGFEYALYPSAVAGGEQTFVADACGYSSSGVVLSVGGYYSQYQICGPFYLDGDYSAAYSYGSIGARLQELP